RLHARDALLPRRGVRNVVFARTRALTTKTAVDAVVRTQQIEYGGDVRPAIGQGDFLHRHVAHDGFAPRTEIREGHTLHRILPLENGECEAHVRPCVRVLLFEIPLAEVVASLRTPAEADGAVRADDFARGLIEPDRLPLRMIELPERAVEVAGPDVAVRYQIRATADELHEERQVREAPTVVIEPWHRALDVELLEDHVPHRHRQGRVRALLRMEPDVRELGDFGVVRRDRDCLG